MTYITLAASWSYTFFAAFAVANPERRACIRTPLLS
jgi:hypothetical protein